MPNNIVLTTVATSTQESVEVAVATDLIDLRDEFNSQVDKRSIRIKPEFKQQTKKTIKHQPQIQRDPFEGSIYTQFMLEERPKRCNKLNWARLRVGSTLLFYTGMRANDISLTTKETLLELAATGKSQFFESKTNQSRMVILAEEAQNMFKRIMPDIDIVYSKHKLLYPTAKKYPAKWIYLLNKYFDLYAKRNNIDRKLTSHSFRINYGTQLLKTTDLCRAHKIISHKNIRSTIRYDLDWVETSNDLASHMGQFLN